MTLKEFVKYCKGNVCFKLVDASKIGYMTYENPVTEAGASVIAEHYGDWELVGFNTKSKTTLVIYGKGE